MGKNELACICAMTGTKLDLFLAAIDLFAAKGYANVSVRDIAAVVKINPASIYNHFPNKEAFLAEAYKFYSENYHAHLPSIEVFIKENANISPYIIWKKIFIYKPDIYDTMTKIILIAINELHRDRQAYALITDVFIDTPKQYIGALLKDMIKRDIIEPIDVDIFTDIVSAYSFQASIRIRGQHIVTREQWVEGQKFIFKSIRLKKPKNN